ncbi:MAG: penicillin-binding protein 2 [Verrucomicrobiota bacterium]
MVRPSKWQPTNENSPFNVLPPFIGGFRYGLILIAIFACFGAIFFRLLHLQVFESDRYVAFAEESRDRYDRLVAARGPIVDRAGNLLASTRTVIELGVDPQALVREDFTKVGDLASILGVPQDEIRRAFEKRERKNPRTGEIAEVRWVKLSDAVFPEDYERIRELGIRGVYGHYENQRVYPAGSMAAHLVGFVADNGEAYYGVEQALDFYLDGQDGWRESEKDGRRREMAQFRFREVAPRSGLGVELSLDLVLQTKVEEELDAIMEEYAPDSASIIVSDPRTGEILALGNRPTFDPNYHSKSDKTSWRNRALTTVYEPGSTFKIVAAAGALNEGLVDPETVFDCSESRVAYNGRTVRMPADHKTYESLSVEQIVVKSSNRGAALLGMSLGDNRLHDYARRFGFGERTGLRLGSESRGILHPVEDWDGLTISRLPMGHAVSATPVQVHAAMATIAGGGIRKPLRLIRRVFDAEGETVLQFNSGEEKRVISEEVAHTMASFLEMVVGANGTARRAFLDGFRAAGKTGTTQMIIDGRYSNEHHVASFSGFLPANQPKVVITVVVEDPQVDGVGYGGVVAAPVFRNIAETASHHLQILPDGVIGQRMIALSEGDR